MKPYYKACLLAFVLSFIHWGAGVMETIGLRPQSIHVWRQCDSASQALNYYQNNVSFWTPQMHSQIAKDGFAASEFPIVYYTVAQLYKLFGFQEYLHRLVNLLIFTAGLVAIFLITQLFSPNVFSSFIPVILVGTSPLMYYYANNFLPNVPAISLVIIGWCFFFYYLKSGKQIQIVAAFFFFTLGSLIKISEAISMVATCTVLAAGWLRWFSLGSVSETWRKHLALKLALTIICFACLLAWNKYVIWFNEANGAAYYLLDIRPIWEMSAQNITDVKNRFNNDWSYVVFHEAVWHLLGLGAVLFVVFYKWFHPLLRLITLLLFLGVTAILLLWFQQLYHHDYYLLTLIMFPLFLTISFVELAVRIDKIQLSGYSRFAGVIILVLFANYIANYNHRVQNQRYFKMKFRQTSPLQTIEPYLRSIGVKRTDLVVSVPDGTTNVSLYLMNNPGWTELFNDSSYNIRYFYTQGAQYLIISDSSYIRKPLYEPFTKHPIGSYKGVNIYSLSNLSL